MINQSSLILLLPCIVVPIVDTTFLSNIGSYLEQGIRMGVMLVEFTLWFTWFIDFSSMNTMMIKM
jgi:hypothetical protein